MVDFKGERLSVLEQAQEVQRMIADLRRKETESLLDLMESKLSNGATVEEVFTMARKAVKILHEFEVGD